MSDDHGFGHGYLLGMLGDQTCTRCRKTKDIFEFPRSTSVIITEGAVTYHNPDGKNVEICNQCHSEIASTPSGN